jgi:two-component system, NarL family, nitrate/nitrite response regulator NarL
MNDLITVGIVDDHPLLREGVAHTLSQSGKFSVVGTGEKAADALRIAHDFLPEIMLLDINMPGGGIDVARQLAAQYPITKIVMLTISENQEHVGEAMEAGARGYILKGISARDLVETLLAVEKGQYYVTPQLAARLLRQPTRNSPALSKLDELTHRETEILGNVAKGLTNKEIARTLSLSEKTVKHYMTNVMQKLQVRNRVEAVLTLRSGSANQAKIAQ